MNFSAFTAPKFGFLLIYSYLCRQLLLTVMRWTPIIYEVCGNHIVDCVLPVWRWGDPEEWGAELRLLSLKVVFRKGFSEVDDLMHNIVGCLIGYGLWLMVYG